jgi:hypothetical protein
VEGESINNAGARASINIEGSYYIFLAKPLVMKF